MFIRVKDTPNSPRKSVQIVASERDGGRVRQRIVRYVGIAMNEDELKRLKDLAEYIKANIEHQSEPSLFQPDELARQAIEARKKSEAQPDKPLNVNLKKLREESRLVVGVHDVYGKLYDELGFDRAPGAPSRRKRAANIIKHLVMARIANPASKRGSVMELERDFGIKLDLTSVYRSLDYLDEKQVDFIKDQAWEAATGLFKEKIDVVFYDCTTLYFESIEEDQIRDKGYSKDMKFGQSQVLLALMVTKEGIPVGYRLYNGSTFEGDTVIDAIKDVEQRHGVNKVVFVADSAMFSDDNLKVIEQYNQQKSSQAKPYKYIVGARIKNQTREITRQILDKESYRKQDGLIYKDIKLKNGRRLLVSYSEQRAKKDAHDRQRAIDKLTKKMKRSKNPQNFISNYGYRKYLNIEGDQKVVLNEQKIQQDARWDGLHGIITNMEDNPTKIFSHYKGLWQVEEGMRITKHDLQTRPIFHWTPDRIRAHVAICFMALVCVRHLTYRVGLQYQRLSAEVIRKELVHVQLSILQHQTTKQRYAIPSKPTQHGRKIYQTMGEKLSAAPFAMS